MSQCVTTLRRLCSVSQSFWALELSAMDIHRRVPRVVDDDVSTYTNAPSTPVQQQPQPPGFALQLLGFILDLLLTLYEKGVPTWGEIGRVSIFLVITGYLALKCYVIWDAWRRSVGATANGKKKKIA